MNKEEKQYLIEQANTVSEIGEISDGYHTFNSLYNQRLCLSAALVNAYKDKAWKSRLHHDGEPCFGGGWFIVGITTPAGDYTYHYELKDWNLFDCKVLDKAPEWDGHTDKDVSRLLTLQPYSHPNWFSVKDELPTIPEKSLCVEVLFRTKYGANNLGKYFGDKWISYEGYTYKTEDISYWMEIQPPRKEE